ncbi:hypothetical protein LTR05_004422 [Lithohypha guttulata]|uniref:2-dehydropantoate 2-reductase n=1 Tax=Lithohypha guttulata TaxID=1690604 RepID=A0AAN7SZN6_9EURO|nr:hypothetical protein LTR05_004422 [Lithohypha guttulata]
MSPKQVLVVGAGAIGAFFAARLASVPGIKVSTLCRSNFSAIKSSGIKVTSPLFGETTFQPRFVFASPEEARKVMKEQSLSWQYLLVATKVLPELGDASALLEGLVDRTTSIVVMQNGLAIEEPYWKRFPRNPIISAVTSEDPGMIVQTTRSTAVFADMLQAAGFPDIDLLDHVSMQFARWHKTAINAAMNPTAVLSGGASSQAMALDRELYTHMLAVMKEIIDAACQVLGRPLPESLPKSVDILDGVQEDVSGSRPSMWLDWEAGRRVELEAILGNPLRQARAVGMELPRTQCMYSLLKRAQEERTQR